MRSSWPLHSALCWVLYFWKRNIREAIEKRTQKPTLNRDTGYDLPAIYDDLLSHDRSLTGGHLARSDSTQRWMKRSRWLRKLRPAPAATRLWKISSNYLLDIVNYIRKLQSSVVLPARTVVSIVGLFIFVSTCISERVFSHLEGMYSDCK